MKNLSYRIRSYSFPNKLNKLIDYLNIRKIEYDLNEKEIKFSFEIDNVNLNCIGNIYKERISSFYISLEDNQEENFIMLERCVRSCYTKVEDDSQNELHYITYQSNVELKDEITYQVEIILTKEPNVSLVVRFEDERHKALDYKVKKRNIIKQIIFYSCALIGLGLSIWFFNIYYNNKNQNTLIILSIISYVYMALSILYLSLDFKVSKKKSILSALLLPLSYIAIGLIVLVILNSERISQDPSILLDSLLWPILSMPAFIIVVIVALVVLFCLGS